MSLPSAVVFVGGGGVGGGEAGKGRRPFTDFLLLFRQPSLSIPSEAKFSRIQILPAVSHHVIPLAVVAFPIKGKGEDCIVFVGQGPKFVRMERKIKK